MHYISLSTTFCEIAKGTLSGIAGYVGGNVCNYLGRKVVNKLNLSDTLKQISEATVQVISASALFKTIDLIPGEDDLMKDFFKYGVFVITMINSSELAIHAKSPSTLATHAQSPYEECYRNSSRILGYACGAVVSTTTGVLKAGGIATLVAGSMTTYAASRLSQTFCRVVFG